MWLFPAGPDSKLCLRSENFPQPFVLDMAHLPAQRLNAWCDYVVGIAVMLRQKGIAIPGGDLLISSEVPMGAGLSSSAAIEVAAAFALLHLAGVKLPLPELAKLCQRAENEFVGVRCGIMDQFISCLGKADHALLLDCRSLDFKLFPLSSAVRQSFAIPWSSMSLPAANITGAARSAKKE